MVHFQKVGERNVAYAVVLMKVNPTMDIVALALANGDVVLHRLITWQRVSVIPKPKQLNKRNEEDNNKQCNNDSNVICDIEWSPGGKILAVSYSEHIEQNKDTFPYNLPVGSEPYNEKKDYLSSIVLYDIDSNKTIFMHSCEIRVSSLCWKEIDQLVVEESKIPQSINIENFDLPIDTVNIPFVDLFTIDDEFECCLLSSYSINLDARCTKGTGHQYGKSLKHQRNSAKSNCAEEDFSLNDFLNFFRNKTFNILLAGSNDGVIQVFSFGLHHLFNIDINRYINKKLCLIKKDWAEHDFKVDQLWISNDFSIINALLTSNELSNFISFECQLLNLNWKEIYILSRIKSSINIRLEYIHDTLEEICAIWDDLIAEIDSKLSNYVSRDDKNVESDAAQDDPFAPRTNKIKLKPDEFIEMLVFGEISLNLERFLTDLTEKGLNKLAITIELCFIEINRLNISKLQRVLYQLYSYLNILKGMTLHDIRFGDLCLSIIDVNRFLRETTAMLIKSIQLQSNLSDSMKKMKAFVRWLHKCLHMVLSGGSSSSDSNRDLADQPNGSNNSVSNATDSNLSTQDLHLIMEFLRENSLTHGFKFENVAYILRAPNSSASTNVDARKSKDNPSQSLINENQDLNKNFYKHFLGEKQLNRFWSIFSKHFSIDSKQLDSFGDGSDTDNCEHLLRIFFPEHFPDVSNTATSYDPTDENSSIHWDKLLFSQSDDINLINDSVYSGLSLYQHLFRLLNSFRDTFNRSSDGMNSLQSEQFRSPTKSDHNYYFQFNPSECNLELEKKTSPFAMRPYLFDCFFNMNFTADSQPVKEDNRTYMYFASVQKGSILSLFRIPLISDSEQFGMQSIELVRLKLCCKCVQPCKCTEPIKLLISNCKFYNHNLLTLILSEIHSNDEVDISSGSSKALFDENVPNQTDSDISIELENNSKNGADTKPVEEILESDSKLASEQKIEHLQANNRHQYLTQVEYVKLFSNPSFLESQVTLSQLNNILTENGEETVQVNKLNLLNLTKNLKECLLKSDPLNDKILEEEMDTESNGFQMDNLDAYFTIRHLGQTSLTELSVSGSRKLACLASDDRVKISTFEMDVSEDELEDEEEENVADTTEEMATEQDTEMDQDLGQEISTFSSMTEVGDDESI